MSRKGFAPILIILLVAGVLAVSGILYAVERSSPPPKTADTENPTAPYAPSSTQATTSPAVTKPREIPISACMPTSTTLGELVDKGVTVSDKLAALGATCRADGTLVDGEGKSITFYYLTGCWGNPPYDYLDILRQQDEKIAALEMKHDVIKMSCNPTDLMIQ